MQTLAKSLMIETTSGNLLNADAQALVNTVNCVGVMGKGIALQFNRAECTFGKPAKS
jgi:O-acetyl-ADP-ribose deacetylase (regulator of RNase III)